MGDAAIIAIRWALYVDLGLLFGLPLFAIYALSGRRADHRHLPIATMIAGLALSGLILSVLGFLIQASVLLPTRSRSLAVSSCERRNVW